MLKFCIVGYLWTTGILDSIATTPHPTMKGNPNTQSFEKLVSRDGPFVDKTLFIKDFLERREDVISISRPHKMGKSLALDMLCQFLKVDGCKECFKTTLKIMDSKYQPLRNKYMHQHPIIFLNFVVRKETVLDATKAITQHIQRVYKKFEYLKDAKNVSTDHKKTFMAILHDQATDEDFDASILSLSVLLSEYHGKKPFIFVDEVDSPMTNALTYDFIRSIELKLHQFLLMSFKVNTAFEKAILCGVLPVFLSSPFTSINNVRSLTIKDQSFQTSFGFTQKETAELISEFGLEKTAIGGITKWYNHLIIGTERIYNPVSVMRCLDGKGKLKVYTNILSGSLINLTSRILSKEGLLPLLNFQVLVSGESLNRYVPLVFEYKNIFNDQAAMYTYFYHAGVITVEYKGGESLAAINVPGKELQKLISDTYIKPMVDSGKLPDYDVFRQRLEVEDVPYVQDTLIKYLQKGGSYLRGKKAGEKVSMRQLVEYSKTVFSCYKLLYGIEAETHTEYDVTEVTMYLKNKTRFWHDFYRRSLVVKLELMKNKLSEIKATYSSPKIPNNCLEFGTDIVQVSTFIRNLKFPH